MVGLGRVEDIGVVAQLISRELHIRRQALALKRYPCTQYLRQALVGRVHTPCEVIRLSHLDAHHPVAHVCLDSVVDTIATVVGRSEHDRASRQRPVTDLPLQQEAGEHLREQLVALEILVKHDDQRLVRVELEQGRDEELQLLCLTIRDVHPQITVAQRRAVKVDILVLVTHLLAQHAEDR
ncbi:MAG: hypothetical protein ACK559_32545 [bacterium]